MKPKEYEIASLADFANVPPERIGACLADFTEWLRVLRDKAELLGVLDAITGVPGGIELNETGFTWVDDGIDGISSLRFVDEQGDLLGDLSVIEGA